MVLVPMLRVREIPFDPETDEDRPEIGEILDNGNGVKWRVDKVSFTTASQIMRGLMEQDAAGRSDEEQAILDRQGYDEVMQSQHPNRPLVYWLMYVTRV